MFELLIPTGRKVNIPHAHIRRSNRLTDIDTVEHLDGLRVTTPARTLFDQAGLLDLFSLRSMAEDALNKELCTVDSMREVATRLAGRGRRGTELFTRYLDERPHGQAPAMSELELRLADSLRDAGLPIEQQRRLILPTGRVVFLDLAVERSLLDIEVDHHGWHAGLVAVQRDKTRDIQVSCMSWHPLRYTDADIERRLPWVVDSVIKVDRWRTRLLRAS